ncbi:MAG: trigger factor [Lachnospiraceae bacterium]|nr:trigger factor [Lachnospiraceae bacterium]
MNFTVETMEKNMAKLTVTVPAADFEKATTTAYNKQKSKIAVPGFRKGKVPQKYLEKMYGAEIFYEDAANICIQDTYPSVVDECELEIVSRPEIDAEQMEKGKDFIYTALVATKPEVTLGEYKGIEVEKADTLVSDNDVDAELERVRMQNRRTVEVTDRASEMGDTVVIDFEGSIDGVPFEGGKGENHPLELGSHTFIEGFEDQLVGKNIGDEVDVNVTFPEDYQAEDLAGKPALFKVKVNAIKTNELPELDDEFASDVSEEAETMEEYREELRKKLVADKEAAARTAKEEAVVKAIIENATMDIPEPMIESTKEQMFNEFAQRISYQGLSIEQYLQFTGMDREKFMETLNPQALERIQSRLVLEAVAKAENLTATDEELDEELTKMAEMYQMEKDKLIEIVGEDEKKAIRLDIEVKKAVDFVVEAATEK